jgi:hypothetical protein
MQLAEAHIFFLRGRKEAHRDINQAKTDGAFPERAHGFITPGLI